LVFWYCNFSWEGGLLEDKADIFIKQLKIEEFILKEIDSRQYKEGTKIPSENELSSAFDVNRHTVRKAIERLCKLGRIYSVQGKGCYVSKKPSMVIYPVLSSGCFSDKLSRRGKSHYSKLLDWAKALPSAEEQKRLGLSEIELIYRLEILRFVDDVPLSLYTSSLPEKRLPDLEKHLVNFSSLYKILREQYGIAPKSKYQMVEATFSTPKDLTYLGINEHISVLKVTSLAELPDGQPIEFVVSRFRSDRYKLKIQFGP
jgi:DNA-binding GntR family transcriptional regulator